MNSESMFQYTYSAPENQEVLKIRSRYLPREETKLEELMRLDRTVQSAGTMQSLCVGIGGCLVFGIGMCLCMKVIGNVMWLGVLLGLLGTAGMILAYPVQRKYFLRAKQEYTPRILELTAELTGENNNKI